MNFAHPLFLLLLAALPLFAWLKGRTGQGVAFLYSSVDLVRPVAGINRSRAGRILASLRWLALALFIVALAQPRHIKGESRVKASGIDIVTAIDLSSSMLSEDFIRDDRRAADDDPDNNRISRIDIAKKVLSKFIDDRPDDRVGLVAFAKRAYIASPLTLDHDYLQRNLSRVRVGLIEDSTAIGDALLTSVNRLRDLKSKSRVVILMTDGQNNAGKVQPLTAAEVAQAMGVKVYTIGVGIRGRAPYPVGINPFTGKKAYQSIDADIDEDTLTKIAQKTGGKYFRADKTETMRQIYAEINRLEKTEADVKKYQQYDELFGWAIIAGLFVFLLEAALSQTVWRKLP
jgi:Ca-activated chloride channel family protein